MTESYAKAYFMKLPLICVNSALQRLDAQTEYVGHNSRFDLWRRAQTGQWAVLSSKGKKLLGHREPS